MESETVRLEDVCRNARACMIHVIATYAGSFSIGGYTML